MTTTPLYVRYSWLELTKDDGAGSVTTLNFQCQSTNIGVTSEGGDITSLNTLCPEGSFSETAERTYSLSITAVQDVENDTPDSLLWFAWDHAGEVWHALYYPKTDGTSTPVGYGLEGDVTVSQPDQVGNVESGNFATSALVWSYQGKPQRVDESGAPVTPPTPPVTVPATGADAGTPGTFTPTGSTPPADFAGMTSITANPTTAWTTGQSVQPADGSDAYWDSTQWTVGQAP